MGWEERNLEKAIENRRRKMFGHLLRTDEFVRSVIDGKRKGGRRRLRTAFSDPIK